MAGDPLERLVELARQASPMDRLCIERTIRIIVEARQAVFDARQSKQKGAARLRLAKATTRQVKADMARLKAERIVRVRSHEQRPFHESFSAAVRKLFPLCTVVRRMKNDPDMTPVRLDRLAYLAHWALSTLSEDRARIESTIQLVCQALQAATWVYQLIGTAEHQRQAAEIGSLRQWIVVQARAAGLLVGDNYN